MKLSNVTPQDLRLRAIGQLAAISALVAVVFAAAVLAGCDAVQPVAASDNEPQGAEETARKPAAPMPAWPDGAIYAP